MIGLTVAADLAHWLDEPPPNPPNMPRFGGEQLDAALRSAPEAPPPPVPADRCPECLAVKSTASFLCRRCQKKWSARARRASLPIGWHRFKGRACRCCHAPGAARGTSGLCRRCYERAWNRRWVRGRRLKAVCLALVGMPFNDLLAGVQARQPKAVDAAQRLLEAVADGRAWIARSPWPTRRGGWGKASGEPSGCGPEEDGSIPSPHSNVSRGTSCPDGQTEAIRA